MANEPEPTRSDLDALEALVESAAGTLPVTTPRRKRRHPNREHVATVTLPTLPAAVPVLAPTITVSTG
jgi:hypothetical protein